MEGEVGDDETVGGEDGDDVGGGEEDEGAIGGGRSEEEREEVGCLAWGGCDGEGEGPAGSRACAGGEIDGCGLACVGGEDGVVEDVAAADAEAVARAGREVGGGGVAGGVRGWGGGEGRGCVAWEGAGSGEVAWVEGEFELFHGEALVGEDEAVSGGRAITEVVGDAVGGAGRGAFEHDLDVGLRLVVHERGAPRGG